PRRSPYFPYTTLFRSRVGRRWHDRVEEAHRGAARAVAHLEPLAAAQRTGHEFGPGDPVFVEQRQPLQPECLAPLAGPRADIDDRSEEHTSELQSRENL